MTDVETAGGATTASGARAFVAVDTADAVTAEAELLDLTASADVPAPEVGPGAGGPTAADTAGFTPPAPAPAPEVAWPMAPEVPR